MKRLLVADPESKISEIEMNQKTLSIFFFYDRFRIISTYLNKYQYGGVREGARSLPSDRDNRQTMTMVFAALLQYGPYYELERLG
jgi:hypothetical protein